MKNYRLYVVTAEENIFHAVEHEFSNDSEALAQAEQLRMRQHAVEVWTGERLVGRVGGDFDFGARR